MWSRGKVVRAAGWLAGGLVLCAWGAVAALQGGALRVRVPGSPLDKEHTPGVSVYRPVDVTPFRDERGEVHYGLLFELPKGIDPGRFEKKCSLSTGKFTPHGPLAYWALRASPGAARLGYVQFLFLIPRRWLILNGFLGPQAALFRDWKFQLSNSGLLQDSFWLEGPPPQGGGPNPSAPPVRH